VARPHTPSTTPHSNPHYPIASSASHQAFTGIPPSYPVHQRAQSQAPVPPKRSRALLIIGPAILLGVVIGVALAFGGGKPPVDAVADEPGSEMPPGENKRMLVTPLPAPAAGAMPESTVPEPAVVESKPAVAEATIDMPEDTVKSADTTKADKRSKERPDIKERADRERAERERADRERDKKLDVAAQFKAGNYGSVMTACNASSTLAQNALVCTMAACKLKQLAKARRWFKQVPDAKKASIRDCDVSPPPPPPSGSDACKTDPMACQH